MVRGPAVVVLLVTLAAGGCTERLTTPQADLPTAARPPASDALKAFALTSELDAAERLVLADRAVGELLGPDHSSVRVVGARPETGGECERQRCLGLTIMRRNRLMLEPVIVVNLEMRTVSIRTPSQ